MRYYASTEHGGRTYFATRRSVVPLTHATFTFTGQPKQGRPSEYIAEFHRSEAEANAFKAAVLNKNLLAAKAIHEATGWAPEQDAALFTEADIVVVEAHHRKRRKP